MAFNAKQKGNSWERSVCKIFGDVFKLNFQRVPTSGAMTGGKNNPLLALLSDSQKLLLRGDIIVPDELSKIVIECKSRKEFPYHKLLHNCRELNEWIDQIGCDLLSDDLMGLIVFKANRRTPFVCYDKKWNRYGFNGDGGMKHGMKNSVCYINYHYKTDYIIEEFNEVWVETNKEFLLEICK